MSGAKKVSAVIGASRGLRDGTMRLPTAAAFRGRAQIAARHDKPAFTLQKSPR